MLCNITSVNMIFPQKLMACIFLKNGFSNVHVSMPPFFYQIYADKFTDSAMSRTNGILYQIGQKYFKSMPPPDVNKNIKEMDRTG